jgi:hypothetical protein
MNTITNANVKCVATLESGSGLDKYGQVRIGSKAWFFRRWKILNPQVDTPMVKKNRDGVLEDMKKMLKLSESQHFEVHVDDTDGISNPVVFYIREILAELAGKHAMTLTESIQTIHDPELGCEKMDFINEAFDDLIAVRK